MRKKLIEVDLPLDDINRESVREMSIRHGHPSTLHLWWARRPLAACRAVIFASLVDDPGDCPEEFPTEEAQRAERARLHGLLKRLVVWEHSNDAHLLAEARWEIARSVARSCGEAPPDRDDRAAVLNYLSSKALPVYDPFCGGGSIPLEAQRLGLRAVGSDLNPVAVLITKALIELPPKVANRSPVNPEADRAGLSVGKGKNRQQLPPDQVRGGLWRGAAGLADDVRYYGRKMREMAWARIGHLYPKAKLPGGGEATVIAWLWARTVPCPNPACGVAMPLMKTFQLSRKRGNEHWTRPVVDRSTKTVSFEVQNHDEGVPAQGTVNRNGATCVACGGTVPLPYVREQARAGNLGEQMTAVVAEGDRRRLFLSPAEEHIEASMSAEPEWRPSGRLPNQALGFRVQRYGFTEWHQLFTQRQLATVTSFCDSLDAVARLASQGEDNGDYGKVIATYLALVIGRTLRNFSSFTRWRNDLERPEGMFGMQTLPMIWDFAETNPTCPSGTNWITHTDGVAGVVESFSTENGQGRVYHADAATTIHLDTGASCKTSEAAGFRG